MQLKDLAQWNVKTSANINNSKGSQVSNQQYQQKKKCLKKIRELVRNENNGISKKATVKTTEKNAENVKKCGKRGREKEKQQQQQHTQNTDLVESKS